jgi:hypothetical protein
MAQARYRTATITAYNEDDGTYEVIPESGRGSMSLVDGVRTIPADVVTLAVGDKVVLVYPRDEEGPSILVTSGGGALDEDFQGFFQGPRDLGHCFLSE